jgi:hypothetical protein
MNQQTRWGRTRPNHFGHLSDVKYVCLTCGTKAGGGDCEACLLITNLRQQVYDKDMKLRRQKDQITRRNEVRRKRAADTPGEEEGE